jgi:predicted DsbA family dithiol-disulfide isomerase
MESWSVGFEGDDDVERHAGVRTEAPPAGRPLHVRMVSDYICPWCFVGLARMERLGEATPVELEPWAYNLRPGLPEEGLPRDEAYRDRHFPPGYRERLKETARQAGIEMIAPLVVANTFKAHMATEFAKEHGRSREFHRAVFEAYWERGQNIGEADVLCAIAEGCRLDPGALGQALADGRYEGTIEEQMAWARAAGLGGVPTFIFEEKFAVVGAQDYDVFADVARRIRSGALKAEG